MTSSPSLPQRVWSRIRDDLPLAAVALSMIGFGIWLRAQALGFPKVMTWDEHHFVMNARNYLAGKADWNDHPPFGKLLMAVPMHFMGDNAVAWRSAQLVAGIGIIFYVGLLVHWVTRDKAAALIAAALIALDGFFVSYSRTALLDGLLTAFALAAVTTALRARGSLGLAVASFLLGSACAIKFSAIVFVPPLLLIALVKRASLLRLVVPVLVPAAYFGWYGLGLHLAHQPYGIKNVLLATAVLLAHHASLTGWKHPLLSHWYEWFLPTRPISIRADTISDGRLRYMTSMGNPATWWLTDLVLLATLGSTLGHAFGALRRGLGGARARLGSFLESVQGRQAVLAVLWSLPVVPWIFTHRDSYIYHYLLAYVFGVALLGSVLGLLYRKRRMLALVAFMAIGQIGVYYAPIWGQLPITPNGVKNRLFIPRWR